MWKAAKGGSSGISKSLIINQNLTAIQRVFLSNHKNCRRTIISWPSAADLRQLYVYHEYYQAHKVALVYPGPANIHLGNYYEADHQSLSNRECSVITIHTEKGIAAWQAYIANQVFIEYYNDLTL